MLPVIKIPARNRKNPTGKDIRALVTILGQGGSVEIRFFGTYVEESRGIIKTICFDIEKIVEKGNFFIMIGRSPDQSGREYRIEYNAVEKRGNVYLCGK